MDRTLNQTKNIFCFLDDILVRWKWHEVDVIKKLNDENLALKYSKRNFLDCQIEVKWLRQYLSIERVIPKFSKTEAIIKLKTCWRNVPNREKWDKMIENFSWSYEKVIWTVSYTETMKKKMNGEHIKNKLLQSNLRNNDKMWCLSLEPKSCIGKTLEKLNKFSYRVDRDISGSNRKNTQWKS